MRYFLETFGCQANDLDSVHLAGLLERQGWLPVARPEDADWVLLNTCAVRRHAEEKVTSRLGVLSEWKKAVPGRGIGLLGCMAVEHKAAILRRFPQVDLVAGPDQYSGVPAALAARGAPRVMADFDPGSFPSNPAGKAGRFKAFVEIMKGCDNRCSYCIVPEVRGREVSRPSREVREEVARLVGEGVKEITLLGQNVNSYRDGAVRFPELLAAVGTLDGVARVRFFTSHPKDLSDGLVEVMASVPAVCEYLHLPVQSGSDAVLRRMNRRYTSAYYRELVGKVRAFVPDIAITTDLIVGFPGETDADFGATLALLDEVRFDSVFSFKYSPRPGTPAAALGDPVPEPVQEERLKRLNDAAWAHAVERHRSRIGRTEEVLVEGPADRTPDSWFGKTRQNKTTVFPAVGRTLSPGDLVQVRMEDNRVACLYGRID
jgi:tRNA-2-methylthio-N6-dimethylallyladenosine synthase